MFCCFTKLIYRQPQPFTHAEHVGHMHAALQPQPQPLPGSQLHSPPLSQPQLHALWQFRHIQCPQRSEFVSHISVLCPHIMHICFPHASALRSQAHMADTSSAVDAAALLSVDKATRAA